MNKHVPAGLDNQLLVTLSKLTKRSEDFVTDSFVHLVRHLAASNPDFTKLFLKDLCGCKFDFDPTSLSIDVRNFRDNKEENSFPDIEIKDTKHHIIIEAKVGAEIDSHQLSKYLELLKQNEAAIETTLVMIIGTKKEENLIPGVKLNRWYDIAYNLEGKAICGNPLTNYLIEQFLELLRWNEVYSYPAIGDLSKEFSKHMERITRAEIPRASSVLFKINRGVKLSTAESELASLPNLRQFLIYTQESIISVFNAKNVLFATFEQKTIGLTFNKLQYGCWIQYSNPDVLWLQFYNGKNGVSADLVSQITLADQDDFSIAQGEYRFNRKINLNHSGYFELSESGKKQFLGNELMKFKAFCQNSFPGVGTEI